VLHLAFKVVVSQQLISEELTISQGGEFLTELNVFRVAVLITSALESLIFGLGKFGVDVVILEYGDSLRGVYVSLLAVFADFELRVISVACYFFGISSPGVELGLGPQFIHAFLVQH
jgi:hypothetical protein